MLQSLLTISGLIGATLIVVRGTIFRPLQRYWPALLQCSQCFGVWVGAAAGVSGIVPLGHGRWVDALIVGAAVSFLSMIADAALLRMLGDPGSEEKH